MIWFVEGPVRHQKHSLGSLMGKSDWIMTNHIPQPHHKHYLTMSENIYLLHGHQIHLSFTVYAAAVFALWFCISHREPLPEAIISRQTALTYSKQKYSLYICLTMMATGAGGSFNFTILSSFAHCQLFPLKTCPVTCGSESTWQQTQDRWEN